MKKFGIKIVSVALSFVAILFIALVSKYALVSLNYPAETIRDIVIIGDSRPQTALNPAILDSLGDSKFKNFSYSAQSPLWSVAGIRELIKRGHVNFIVEISPRSIRNQWKSYDFDRSMHYSDRFFSLTTGEMKTIITNNPRLFTYLTISYLETTNFLGGFLELENGSFNNVSPSQYKKMPQSSFDDVSKLYLELIKQNPNSNFLFFTAPTLEMHATDDIQFMKLINDLVEHENSEYVDLSDAVQDSSQYRDYEHLNSSGSTHFSKIFIQVLSGHHKYVVNR